MCLLTFAFLVIQFVCSKCQVIFIEPSPDPSPFPIERYDDRVFAANHVLKEDHPSLAALSQFTNKQLERIHKRFSKNIS